MDNLPYVFISYSHRDEDKVLPSIDAMKNCGISLWYDERIQAGSEWPEFVAEKLLSCSLFVLFVSNNYINSQNCKRELNYAISKKKTILSIFIEDVTLSPGIEMQLGSYQALYMKNFLSESDFINSLCKEHYFDICRKGSDEHLTDDTSEPLPQEPGMATLVVNRKFGLYAILRNFTIFLDDIKIGKIKKNETKEFKIAEGFHFMQLKFDGCSSNILKFTVKKGEKVYTECTTKMLGIIVPDKVITLKLSETK